MKKVLLFGDRVEVTVGDITTFEVDAIVNPVNCELILGGGVSGAIIKAGGVQIQQECERFGNIGLGEVVVTSAGNLKAKYILHAATLSLGTWATSNSVKKALHNVLETSEKLKLKTIAIPALGGGIGALSISKIASIFYDELKQFFTRKEIFIEKIFIVLYDEYIYNVFINTMEETQDGRGNKLVK